MITLIKSLAKSLELYLKLKNKLYFNEIVHNHNETKTKLINEIEKLRDAGDSNSADVADLLRQKLRTEDQQFEYLSTVYLKSSSGAED